MKKLFCGIGFLLVVFCSLQFFLVVEEKVVYLNDEQPYDIMLEEFMTASEIEQIAKENDVTLVNRECISNLFGKRHYKFNIINPSDKMKEGQEKILFGTGKKEIIFIKASSEKRFKHLFLFDNDENKYKNVLQSLNKRKYIYETDKLQRLNISWNIILLEKSRKFLF